MTSKLLILFTLFGFMSCSLMERRDFSDQMDYDLDEPMFRANQDFMVVPGDSGRGHRSMAEIQRRTPATQKNRADLTYRASLKGELINLENQLSDREYFQYSQYASKIGTVSERIYFLKLTPWDREEYLQLRRLKDTSYSNSRPNRNYQSSPQRQIAGHFVDSSAGKDVRLGMGMSDVAANWGEPLRRDVAGQSEHQNERWTYRRNGQVKYIYFGGGKVEGWGDN